MKQFLLAKLLQELTSITIFSSFDRHSLVPHNLIHRTEPVKVWCHPGGSTYITVALIHGDVPAQAFKFMLNAAMNRVINHLALYGNGLIPSGVFIQPDQVGFFELYLANSNNHQQTWGVVGAALSALSNFMVDNDSFSTSNFKAGVTFTVFDGANEVGQGSVS